LSDAGSIRSGAKKSGGLRSYFARSADPFTSVVLVLPLFVLYQVGVLSTNGVGNGLDFMTATLFRLTGGDVALYLAFNAVVLLGFVVALLVLRTRGHFEAKLIPWMMLESTLYALLFGTVVISLMQGFGLGALLATAAQPAPDLFAKVVLSVGAGLYEELVFRVVVLGGLFFALTRFAGFSRIFAAVVAVIVSSAVFSGVHHLGALGEPFTLGAFAYRFFAGLVLAFIFQVRGFAIAAYTHALYDVWVMVFLGK
jgi:membrane protease YdiL (CAAX protease family)